jgi:alkylated DNA repair dioxygenase AlkB
VARGRRAGLGRNPVIASVLFGATRRFGCATAATGLVITLPLTDGSLLLMAGETQHRWVMRCRKRPPSGSA